MARKPRDYHAEYARRLARAANVGKTKQQARGHGRAAPGAEHRVRAERAIARGALTEADLKYLRGVEYRTGPIYGKDRFGRSVVKETAESRYERAARAYREMSPEQREMVRTARAQIARSYKRSIGRQMKSNRFPRANPRHSSMFYDLLAELNDGELPDIEDDYAPLIFYK